MSENGKFSEKEQITRPDVPEILRDLFAYLSEARALNLRFVELAEKLEAELSEREAQKTSFLELEKRVRVLELANAQRAGA